MVHVHLIIVVIVDMRSTTKTSAESRRRHKLHQIIIWQKTFGGSGMASSGTNLADEFKRIAF